MEHYASKALCTELYKLKPEWDNTAGELSPKGHYWPRGEFVKFHTGAAAEQRAAIVPAYDLGFLIRKLPKDTVIWQNDFRWHIRNDKLDESASDPTPEDVGCLLLIKLIKEGILK